MPSSADNVITFTTRQIPRFATERAPKTAVDSPLRVLIIDDSPEDRMVVRLALEAEGFLLSEADNGERGLEAVAAQLPDCILLDYKLPDFDGLELLKLLHRPDGGLPCAVVGLTGSLDAKIASKLVQAGAIDYINKQHINSDSLRSAVQGAVQRYHLLEDRRLYETRNAQLAAIIDSSADAIFSVGLDMVVRTWNAGAAELFGYTEAEAVGQTIDDIIVPEDRREERARFYQSVVVGRQSVLAESVRRHKDGRLIDIEINASPMLAQEGQAVAISIVMRDIGERKRSEARFTAIRDALSTPLAEAQPSDQLPETRSVAGTSAKGVHLEQIRETGLFDTPREHAFDQITRLASTLLHAPVSLMTIIDDNRQFFVSSQGLPEPLHSIREKPLGTSYCRYAIESAAPVVIRDASENPLVEHIGAWKDGFISYLAVPILDRNDVAIASLSVADSITRAWTHRELNLLSGMAKLLMREIENRAAVRALQVSEARYRSIFDNAATGIVIGGANGRISQANPAFCALLGYTENELRDIEFKTLLHPDDREDNVTKIKQVRNGEIKSFELENRYIHKDGRDIFVRKFGAVLPSESGNEKNVFALVTDVTEAKRAQRSVLEAYNSFRTTVEHSPFGIYTVDADFRVMLVASGAQKVFENVRPLIGRDFADVIRRVWPEPFASEVIARFRHTLETGQPYRGMSSAERRHDIDEVEAYDWKIERTSMPDGRLGVVCYFYDLSERERYESAMRASEQRLRLATDAACVGIWMWQPEQDRVIWENEWPSKILDIPHKDEPISFLRLASDFVHPDDRGHYIDAVAASCKPGGSLDFECRILRRDGQQRWVQFKGKSVTGVGTTACVLGTSRDITERKEREHQVQFLLREVNHRSKNMLAVVQAIARHTVRSSPNDFVNSFSERVQALAAYQDILIRSNWEGAGLVDLVRAQLTHFKDLVGVRIEIEGEPLRVSPAAAQTISMALYELATNASKYGALSNDTGRISITWQVTKSSDGAERFQLSWLERGGPLVVAPVRRGFGSLVIDNMAKAGLAADARLEFLSSGLEWHLDCLLERVRDSGE
jgi:PAS domain S-box-containing protein